MGAKDNAARGYHIIDERSTDAAAERQALVEGLRATPATLSPKYFYDELGCALYGAICQLPEYYPTRTEVTLFQQYRDEIASAVGRGKQFVDLGAGDCCKAESWLPFLLPSRYVAVDIALPEIDRALSRLSPEFPEVEMLGLATDFSRELKLDSALSSAPATFFYPGSSIGNFAPNDAKAFLRRVREECDKRPGSGLLIGVDAKKAKPRLDAAYDDALGVTASFNLNALLHVNRVLGCDFHLRDFRHLGFYNEALGRIEMHLAARHSCVVTIDGAARHFAAGETIHTENSYKYSAGEFQALLADVGFGRVQVWSMAPLGRGVEPTADPGASVDYNVYFATAS
jgi:dimethylhistidine N-methyltransferase